MNLVHACWKRKTRNRELGCYPLDNFAQQQRDSASTESLTVFINSPICSLTYSHKDGRAFVRAGLRERNHCTQTKPSACIHSRNPKPGADARKPCLQQAGGTSVSSGHDRCCVQPENTQVTTTRERSELHPIAHGEQLPRAHISSVSTSIVFSPLFCPCSIVRAPPSYLLHPKQPAIFSRTRRETNHLPSRKSKRAVRCIG